MLRNRPVEFASNVDVVHEAFDVEWQVRRVGAHKLFQFLTLLVEAHKGPWLGAHIQLVSFGKFVAEVLNQYLIEILATELGVER